MKSSSLSVLFFMVMSTMPSMVFGASVAARAATAPQVVCTSRAVSASQVVCESTSAVGAPFECGNECNLVEYDDILNMDDASVAARAASASQVVRASVERGNERNLVEYDDILSMDDADQQRVAGLGINFVARFIESLAMIMSGAQDDSYKIKQDLNKLLGEIRQIINRNIESNNNFIANRFESKDEMYLYYGRLHNEIKEWFIDNFESYVQRINHIPQDNKLERLREFLLVFFEATRRDFVQISHIVEKEFEATVKPYVTSMMELKDNSVASNHTPMTMINGYMNNAQNFMQNFIQHIQGLIEKFPLTEKEKRLMHIHGTIMDILTPVVMRFRSQMVQDAIKSLVIQNVDFESQGLVANSVPRDNVSEQDRKDFENSHKVLLKKCVDRAVSLVRQALKDLTPSEDRFVKNLIVAQGIKWNGVIEGYSRVRTMEDMWAFVRGTL